jgi:nitrate/nitrite transporter NarK
MPHRYVGRTSGLVLSIGAVGGFIGPIIGGRILDLTGSLNQAFILLAIIAAVTIAVTFLLPETGSKIKIEPRERYESVESQ